MLHQTSTELRDFQLGVARAIESTSRKLNQFHQIALSPQVDEGEANFHPEGMISQTDDTGKVRHWRLS